MVASRVRAEMAASGRTTQWLAEQAGITTKALQNKLALRADFTVVDLAGIAHALEISVEELVPPAR
ncbi:hypothetical protein [Microbacterium foliorum]|uniref:hypothetical protein n=1 Tax=Microbacterium foliorum TaxID=104336 RepID=UPI001E41DE7A|nr:hypothetical protein [Microbacterium foliorum]